MIDEPEDPVAELQRAQRRLRKRALVGGAIVVVAVAAIVAVLVLARSPTRALPAITRPYLWRVTPATPGARPSFLFGTMHVGFGLADLPRAVLRAQDEADVTVVESDLLTRPAPGSAVLGSNHDGAARLEPAAWQRLARRTGRDVDTLTALPTAQLLGLALAGALPPGGPLDRDLQARALWRGQRVHVLESRGLEAVLAQPAAGAADDAARLRAERDADRGLVEGVALMIDNPGPLRVQLRALLAAYATGADAACPQLGGGTAGLVPRLNAAWIAAVDQHVRRGAAFIAVGCAHLVGDESIVARLRSLGHDVVRVDRAP